MIFHQRDQHLGTFWPTTVVWPRQAVRLITVPTNRRGTMDAFFILPIVILLALLAWCVLQLKDDM